MKKLVLHSTKELRAKKPAEIEAYVSDLGKYQVTLQHDLGIGKAKTSHQLTQTRRAIARAKTLLSEMKREEKK